MESASVPFKRVLLTSDDFLVRDNMCKTVEQKLRLPAFGIKFNWALLSFMVKTQNTKFDCSQSSTSPHVSFISIAHLQSTRLTLQVSLKHAK